MANSVPPEQELHNMGYRPLDPDKHIWAKPVGYSILVFDRRIDQWSQEFRHAEDGSVLVWVSMPWVPEEMSLTNFLAYQEQWHMRSVGGTTEVSSQPWNFRTEWVLDV